MQFYKKNTHVNAYGNRTSIPNMFSLHNFSIHLNNTSKVVMCGNKNLWRKKWWLEMNTTYNYITITTFYLPTKCVVTV